jgi:endoglucanase
MHQGKESLYCGELGAIDRAPVQTRINWTRDMIDVLNDLKIGYAYWSYTQMDYGLVDTSGTLVNDELLRIVTQR